MLGRGARGLLRERLGDRLLKGRGDVVHRHLALRLERAHETLHRGLQTREREVVAIGHRRAR